jgi:hypothetical protein
MGPAIEQVEGRLVQRDSDEYVVSVTGVHLMNGMGDQVWHGEVVHLKTAHVAAIYERRLSAGRSAALGSAAVGAVVAIATRSLAGLGSTERPVIPGDSATTVRRPRR